MRHKAIKGVGIVLIILIALTIYGLIRYNSTENKVDRLSRAHIMDWYTAAISLDTRSISQEDLEKRMRFRKLKDHLDGSWEFGQQTINIEKLNMTAFFITISDIFKNQNSGTYFLIDEYYYYDRDEIDPVILKRETSTYTEDSKYAPVSTQKLWDGDFDVYCKKP